MINKFVLTSIPGGGILPIMAYTARGDSTRKGYAFRLQVYFMVGISLVEVYEGQRRKSVNSVCKQAQNGEQIHFMDGKKLGKRSGL